jgi:putative ABC transport system permease protein
LVNRRAFSKVLERQILWSPGRFIAILLIVLVGVAFSVGVRATCPDMKSTCDAYLDAANCQDIWIVSGIGFTPAEIERIRRMEGVDAVQGGYTFDALASSESEDEKAVRILSMPNSPSEGDINRPVLLSGRLPEGPGECVAEKGNFLSAPAKVGDRVRFSTAQGTWTLSVVGIAQSPLFISWERGANSLGDGTTACYFLVSEDMASRMYLPKIDWPDGFTTDRFYPEVHITLTGAQELDSFGRDYARLVKNAKGRLRSLAVELTGSDEYWFILDRDANAGIHGFASDAQRVGNVGKVFPVIFFLVAALVSLTSMTRLIDEQRVQIGTLKALGYARTKIVGQYVLYAAAATLGGGAVGAAIGFPVLPRMIYSMYGLMYSVGPLSSPIIARLAAQEILAALLCTMGATAAAGMRDLMESPAALMRPKAPKAGRRVLLERLPAIWKRLSFIQKVTVRNIFRYRKRLWMTLAGIAGCTALLVTGFGLNDSLRALTHSQFGEIYHYDFTCILYNSVEGKKADDRLSQFTALSGVESAALSYAQGVSISADKKGENELDATLIVPRNPEELSRYVSLKAGDRNLALPNSGAVLTRKASELMRVRAGDTIRITLGGRSVSVPVAAITEQYILHFVYLSPQAYRAAFGDTPAFNQVIARTRNTSDAFERELGKKILASGDVRTVLFTSSANKIWDDTMRNMSAIVTIIVVSAGLLAFIVVYTLTSINIMERTKELATIKVLGFRNGELAQYVFRENAILTILGIALGLGLGIFLHRWVILTAEVDVCMFGRSVRPASFLWSAALSLFFAFSVNLVMYPRLSRIDMVQAMKSVE